MKLRRRLLSLYLSLLIVTEQRRAPRRKGRRALRSQQPGITSNLHPDRSHVCLVVTMHFRVVAMRIHSPDP